MRYSTIMLLISLLLPLIALPQSDSSVQAKKTRKSFNASLSASYTGYNNWNGNNHNALTLLSNAEYKHRVTIANGWSHDHYIRTELGFMNFTDSVWVKHADQFRIGLQWNERPGKYLTHSYTFFMQSQFLNTWDYEYDDEKEKPVKVKKAWFMAPGKIEAGYGLNWRFWESCRMNVAFASLKISTLPATSSFKEVPYLLRTKNKIVKSEYGFSAQVFINKEFYDKHLVWDHMGRVFFNALAKESVTADVSNRVTIKFLKFMQLRTDLHFIYEPDFSTKPSWRLEVLLGVFYELKK